MNAALQGLHSDDCSLNIFVTLAVHREDVSFNIFNAEVIGANSVRLMWTLSAWQIFISYYNIIYSGVKDVST